MRFLIALLALAVCAMSDVGPPLSTAPEASVHKGHYGKYFVNRRTNAAGNPEAKIGIGIGTLGAAWTDWQSAKENSVDHGLKWMGQVEAPDGSVVRIHPVGSPRGHLQENLGPGPGGGNDRWINIPPGKPGSTGGGSSSQSGEDGPGDEESGEIVPKTVEILPGIWIIVPPLDPRGLKKPGVVG